MRLTTGSSTVLRTGLSLRFSSHDLDLLERDQILFISVYNVGIRYNNDITPIWEWFIPTIYGDLGDALLFIIGIYPHYTALRLDVAS